MKQQETIKVNDRLDFHYEVELHHHPELGYSTAYHRGERIADTEAYKIHEPLTDDDREWEMYQDRFGEWRDQVLSRLKPYCVEHFNRLHHSGTT